MVLTSRRCRGRCCWLVPRLVLEFQKNKITKAWSLTNCHNQKGFYRDGADRNRREQERARPRPFSRLPISLRATLLTDSNRMPAGRGEMWLAEAQLGGLGLRGDGLMNGTAVFQLLALLEVLESFSVNWVLGNVTGGTAGWIFFSMIGSDIRHWWVL